MLGAWIQVDKHCWYLQMASLTLEVYEHAVDLFSYAAFPSVAFSSEGQSVCKNSLFAGRANNLTYAKTACLMHVAQNYLARFDNFKISEFLGSVEKIERVDAAALIVTGDWNISTDGSCVQLVPFPHSHEQACREAYTKRKELDTRHYRNSLN